MSATHVRWVVVAATVAALTAAGPPAPAAVTRAAPARVVTITIPARHGAIPQRWLSYPGPPRANVLLPAGYDPHHRYRLLVLLNALANRYDSYVQDGIVAKIIAAKLDAIVVMPEGGNGWYADWWDRGRRARPAWESYELDDVLPAVLDRYPILPGRRNHAIAGFSMGGLGAVYLAGRLPGFFGSAATLSGFVDTQYFAAVSNPVMALLSGSSPARDGLDPIYGPPDGYYADGHNPTLLAANLRHTRVFESAGTGVPSSAGVANATAGDPNATVADAYGSVLESLIIHEMAESFHRALVATGVDVTYQVHPGGHDLPDFYQEWDSYIAWNPFRPVAAHPMSWRNATVADHGRLWDVRYRFARLPDRVVRFHRSRSMLSISAAGTPVTIIYRGRCRKTVQTPARIALKSGCAGRPRR
ncbi:MAG TPA: alpha/beta hydrolase-fold protein [Mycobacteriales bacterium]|nr:alpha/beta hydrolase-fold protein [Mycobacteriales bacterium]